MSRLSSTDTPNTQGDDDGSSDDGSSDDVEAPAVDHVRSDLLARLVAHLGSGLIESHLVAGQDLWVRVHRDAWVEAGDFAKNGLGFAYFNFLSGIDWMPSPFGRDMDAQVDLDHGSEDPAEPAEILSGVAGGDTRFQVFARVNDIVNGLGITLKVDLPDDDLSVASWVPVFPGADWHERECWEMYGINFKGHPGLRHLYLPGEFEGNPLRKDYPLLARRIKPWPGIVDVEKIPVDEDTAAGGDQ